MYDLTTTAQNVSDWSALGVDLPASLTKPLGLLEEARWVEAPVPVVDLDKLTAKNLGQAVEQVTDDLLRAEKHAQAKRVVLDKIARRVLQEAGAAVPGIIEQLNPRFDAAAAAFKAAVDKLPEDLTADALVKAGPEALVALGEARTAAATIRGIDSWLASLRGIPAYSLHNPHPSLRVFAPENPDQLRVLVKAHNDPNVDPLVRDLGPVLLAGIRAGVPTALHTPDDAAQLEQQLEDEAAAAARRLPRGVTTLR